MASFLGRNIWVIVIAAIVIAGGIWYTMRGEQKTPTVVTTQTAGGTAERQVVDILLALRAVTLTGTIFSDPAFKTLVDFGTQIVPEPVGRPNPFAPRGASQGTTTGQTSRTSPTGTSTGQTR